MPNAMLTFGLCPYVDCACKLDLARNGWFICGACGKVFWAVHESKIPGYVEGGESKDQLRQQFYCYLSENRPPGWPEPTPFSLPIPTVRSLGKSKWSPETH